MNKTIDGINCVLKKCEDKLNAKLSEKGILYSDEAHEMIMSELGIPNQSVSDDNWHL